MIFHIFTDLVILSYPHVARMQSQMEISVEEMGQKVLLGSSAVERKRWKQGWAENNLGCDADGLGQSLRERCNRNKPFSIVSSWSTSTLNRCAPEKGELRPGKSFQMSFREKPDS